LATLVEKETVLGNKDVVLSGERYVESTTQSTDYPMVKIGDVVEINSQAIDPIKIFKAEPFVYIDIEAVENGTGKVSFNKLINPNEAPSRARRVVKNGDVLVSTVRPNLKAFAYLENVPKNCLASTGFAVLSENENVLGQYLYYAVNQDSIVEQMVAMSGKGQYPSITASDLAEISIPLPPLEIQQQIVAEIEGYQKIIDGAKQIVNNYKPVINYELPITNYEMVELGTIGKISMCKRVFKEQTMDRGDVPFYKIGTFGGEPDAFISQELFNEYQSKFSYPKKGDILISTSGTIGKIVVFDGRPAYFQDSNIVWIANDETKVLNTFLKICYQTIKWRPSEGVTIARLYNGIIEETKIPIPSLEEQQTIVKAIEEEMQLVNANKRLVEIFEQKIKTKIGEVWGVKNLEVV
jgi:restriction endonuclease S subunit